MMQVKFDKKKLKRLGILSLMVMLFMVVMCWIFLPAKSASETQKKKGGLNTQLPGANVKKDSATDKAGFYSKAQIDSAKHAEEIRMDPNRKDTVNKMPAQIVGKTVTGYGPSTRPVKPGSGNDPLERVRSLQRQLSSSAVTDPPGDEHTIIANQNQQLRKNSQPAPDPEMEAINATLDKIMAIQHPKSIAASNSAVNPAGYAVSPGNGNDATYFGKRNTDKTRQTFFGGDAKQQGVAVRAVVPYEQEVVSGRKVKLELGSAITVGGITIPEGTAVYGKANIEGERLYLSIVSISYGDHILAVSLSVCDLDGMEGIDIPGSVARDVVKESTDGAIQSTGVTGFSLSPKTRIAAAGINAAKSLLSRKVKQVRVTITAGYKVLLRDNKQTGY